MRWSNQAIIANAEISKMVRMVCESAFKAWMYMYAEHEHIMPQPIIASAYGCPNLDNKLAWNIWLEHYNR